jgi:hypothetical protein
MKDKELTKEERTLLAKLLGSRGGAKTLKNLGRKGVKDKMQKMREAKAKKKLLTKS